MEDARKQSGRWYCSPSCLLQGSAGRWKQPGRRWRGRLGWTLGIIVVLFVGLIVLGAVGGTSTKKPSVKSGSTRSS
jgi:hypothetical protein